MWVTTDCVVALFLCKTAPPFPRRNKNHLCFSNTAPATVHYFHLHTVFVRYVCVSVVDSNVCGCSHRWNSDISELIRKCVIMCAPCITCLWSTSDSCMGTNSITSGMMGFFFLCHSFTKLSRAKLTSCSRNTWAIKSTGNGSCRLKKLSSL